MELKPNTMRYVNASLLNYEHFDWLKAIDFYKDDLSVLQKRLAEVAFKNSGKEVAADVEHFQNQLIVQRNNLEELSHNIYEHIHHVVENSRTHAGKVAYTLVEEHGHKKDEFTTLMSVIKSLRKDFNTFLAKWM
jgi:hypothetical protein